MPIECSIPIQTVSLDEFRALDYQLMSHAFACQNAIGSLADERVYQSDLAARLVNAGFQIDREVAIKLSHNLFQKSLYLDLVINRNAVYELKVAVALSDAHRSQLLTYLYLLNLDRGKLVNFATQKVQTEFVNAALPDIERHSFDIDKSKYCGPAALVDMIVDLVSDWGTALSLSLYREAIVHLAGGPEQVEAMLPMKRDSIDIGSQRFCVISQNEAFQITTINKPNTDFQSHLERLIQFSPIVKLHWVNIERHRIQFITVQN